MKKKGIQYPSFFDFLNHETNISNFNLYSINGNIITDYMIRYEILDKQLAEVSRIINLPETLTTDGIMAKGNVRLDKRPYTEVFNDKERALIEQRCYREIVAFNYKF